MNSTNSTHWDIDTEKSPINPVTQTPEFRQKALEKVSEYHYPRHISQHQPKPSAIAANLNLAERKADSYTEVEQRNLCPRLNYYQPATATTTAIAEIHLVNIRQNLEKRIKAAQATDNQELVKVLEQEWSALELNALNLPKI